MATEICINTESVQSFFSKLESRKALLSTITDIHKTLTSHFSTVDQSLSRKSQTLDAQIKSLQQNTRNAFNELHNREDGIPERERSMSARIEELRAAAVAEIECPDTAGKLKEKSLSEMLRFYCRRMDARGLMKFLFRNTKESAALRAEIPDAVQESVDAMRLVLDAAEEYVGMRIEGKSGMADRRRACGMLIQSVLPLKEGGVVVGRTLKERAASVLEKWKVVLGGGDKSSGIRPNEASMFLQLAIGFGLKQEFQEDFLMKLVVQFASRRDMPKLAIALGFGNKIPDIIEQLVKSGKEIEAVYFATEAGLTEQYPPVSLLKSSLRNCKRNAKDASKKGNFSTAAVEKANNLELDATKAIMQCVEDLKLETQFPLEELKNRVDHLESAKNGKKKNPSLSTNKPNNTSLSTNRPSRKRPLGGGGGEGGRGTAASRSRPPKAGRFSSAYPRNPPRTHLVPPPARYSGPYNYPPNHAVYEGHATSSYGPVYSETHTQSLVTYSQQYGYSAPDVTRGPTHYGAVAQAPGTYGESPVAPGTYGGQYGYSTPDVPTSALRGTTQYAPQAQGIYGDSPSVASGTYGGQYGYSTPDVPTSALRGSTQYTAQAQGIYGESPAVAPGTNGGQYGYSPQDASRVTSHEAHGSYDYSAAASATAFPSSYQT